MKITITRAEGPINVCGKAHECVTFEAADALLRRWSNTAPEGGCYDKCDFTIVDETVNFNYAGRYDLKHWREEAPSLKRHVVEWLEFTSGRACPSHMTQERYDQFTHGKRTQEELDGIFTMAQYLKVCK